MKKINLLLLVIAGMTVISCTKEYEPNPGANVNALLQDLSLIHI